MKLTLTSENETEVILLERLSELFALKDPYVIQRLNYYASLLIKEMASPPESPKHS